MTTKVYRRSKGAVLPPPPDHRELTGRRPCAACGHSFKPWQSAYHRGWAEECRPCKRAKVLDRARRNAELRFWRTIPADIHITQVGPFGTWEVHMYRPGLLVPVLRNQREHPFFLSVDDAVTYCSAVPCVELTLTDRHGGRVRWRSGRSSAEELWAYLKGTDHGGFDAAQADATTG